MYNSRFISILCTLSLIICLFPSVIPLISCSNSEADDNDTSQSSSFSNPAIFCLREDSRVPKPVGSGPHSTSYVYVEIPTGTSSIVPARIYYPRSGTSVDPSKAPYHGIAFAPGAGGYETSYSSILSQIASWGYIVTIVGTGGPCNQEVVDIQSYIIDYYEELNSNSSSIFYNKINTSCCGASGHSNGGWAAIAGAVADQRYKAVSPLAAAAGPNHGTGQANTRNLHVPLQLISGANDYTFLPSSDAYYASANPIKSYLKIIGAGHGGPFNLEYLISFFKYWLNGEKEYGTFIYGEEMQKDIKNNIVEYTADLGITVEPSASSKFVFEDEPVALTCNAYIINPISPDRYIVEYAWDFDSDGEFDWESDKSEPAYYSNSKAGTYQLTVKVTDSWEFSASSELEVNVNNKKPVADAGEDITAHEDEDIWFDGSGSSDTTSDLESLRYLWDFGDGNLTGWGVYPKMKHNYTMMGNYTARLYVKDDDEAVDSIAKLVSIQNVKPTAVIDINKIELEIDEIVQFNGGSSIDTRSDIGGLKFAWDFGDSQVASGIMATHSYENDGKYLVTLTVTDDDGAKDIATETLTVQNSPPSCVAMDDLVINEDDIVEFSGTGHDSKLDSKSLQFCWDFGVPGIPGTSWLDMAEFSFKYTNAGVYTATLTVRDDNGETGSDSVEITVNNIKPTSKFTATSQKINEDDEIMFDASVSSDSVSDQPFLNYTWDFDDGSPLRYGIIQNHEFQNAGEFEVILTVRDDNSESDAYSLIIEVENVAPTASIKASKEKAKVGITILFSAYKITDSNSDIDQLTFQWNFGDKSTGVGRTVSHEYKKPGRYDVTLTVTDDDGESNEARISVSVSDLKDTEPKETEAGEDNTTLTLMGFINIILVVFLIIILFLLFTKYQRSDGK